MSHLPPFSTPRRTVSRRQFLQSAGLFAAGGALAACAGTQQRTLFEVETRGTTTPVVALPSPAVPGPQPTPAPELAQFLALSAALTGMTNLDPRLGQVYWDSLQGNGQQQVVMNLFEQVGQAEPSLETIQSAGLFEDARARQVVGDITKLWYTGVYSQGEDQAVAAYTDALAWKSLRFTKPATLCGSFGFWAVRPLVDVSSSAGPVAPALPSGEA